MPRAEKGSAKSVAAKMKAKGLGRLRWYCQACERQMRDENGFKLHCQSENHVRSIMVMSESSGKHIADFSRQFQHDMLQLLRTSHGEKKVNLNHFYNQYISDKQHIHMNATRWQSLTEFGKFLGREGLCRVEEGDRGLEISWIDNSPEALRRQDAIKKKERQDKGDEERELRQMAEQLARAKREAEGRKVQETNEEAHNLQRNGEEKLKLNFGNSPASNTEPLTQVPLPQDSDTSKSQHDEDASVTTVEAASVGEQAAPSAPKTGFKMSGGNKPRNVFAAASKKNALSGKAAAKLTTTKPMSEAERIMKEELERKRRRESGSLNGPPDKRVRI